MKRKITIKTALQTQILAENIRLKPEKNLTIPRLQIELNKFLAISNKLYT